MKALRPPDTAGLKVMSNLLSLIGAHLGDAGGNVHFSQDAFGPGLVHLQHLDAVAALMTARSCKG